MNKKQNIRLFLIVTAILGGIWLPLRLVGFRMGERADLNFDFIILVSSGVSIYSTIARSMRRKGYLSFWAIAWIVADLLALIPSAWLPPHTAVWLRRLILLANVVVVRHVWKVRVYLNEFDSLHPVAYRVTPILLMLPLLVHFVACGWIALGSGTAGMDPDKLREYIKAVYWSFATLTTVGYGDISAKSSAQMLYSCAVLVIGVGLFGYVLSNVASLLSRLDATRENHVDNLERAELFMRNHRIPGDIRSQVRAYYHYVWTQHKGYNSMSMLTDLPNKIQSELLLHINQTVIQKVSFLKGASRDLLEDLTRELKPRICVPGERVFRVDETGDALYFIEHGTVDILSRDNVHIANLQEGACFGEMALISDSPRNATAQAVTYCDLYMLPKASFQRVMQAYPQFRKDIELTGQSRQVS